VLGYRPLVRPVRVLLVGVVVVGLAALGVVALASVGEDEGGVEVSTTPRTVDDAPPNEGAVVVDPPRQVALLGPTDGVASRLLPVVVEPSTGLTGGQTVAISGSGFTPGASLGAVLCSAGAAGGGGVAYCELAHYDNFNATSDGTFADDYVLRRTITTPADGQVDCAAATDACILAVGNVSDYDESGGSYISYRGAPDPPPPALVVSPAEGLTDGAVVSVKGSGLRAAADGELRQCPADRVTEVDCTRLAPTPDGPPVAGQLSATVTVTRSLMGPDGGVDCAVAPGCVLATSEYAGRVGTVALGFAPTDVPPTTVAAAPIDPGPAVPTLTVEPATGLVPGDEVRVRAEGLQPGRPYYVEQCEVTAAQPDVWVGCLAADATALAADGSGRIEKTVLLTATVFTDTEYDCTTSRPGACTIILRDDSRHPVASAALEFG